MNDTQGRPKQHCHDFFMEAEEDADWDVCTGAIRKALFLMSRLQIKPDTQNITKWITYNTEIVEIGRKI